MLKVLVIGIDDGIYFDNGMSLTSEHWTECCEHHYLSFNDLDMKDFKGLEFNLDLEDGNFFKRIAGYGIELVPINGWSVKIPGYGDNNGYYSENINLVLKDANDNVLQDWDVTECQNY